MQTDLLCIINDGTTKDKCSSAYNSSYPVKKPK